MVTAETDSPYRSRAVAMPAEERRAAILEATVPLLVEHGTEITTRQIAEAAGVAEGTIFRVFADKESVVDAALAQAFDPTPVVAELGAIEPTLPLDVRCEAAVTILQDRLASLWRLLDAVGRRQVEDRKAAAPPETIVQALVEVLEPDRAHMRLDPMSAAAVLRVMTIAGSHPALYLGDPMTPREIVSVVLEGIRVRSQGERAC